MRETEAVTRDPSSYQEAIPGIYKKHVVNIKLSPIMVGLHQVVHRWYIKQPHTLIIYTCYQSNVTIPRISIMSTGFSSLVCRVSNTSQFLLGYVHLKGILYLSQ